MIRLLFNIVLFAALSTSAAAQTFGRDVQLQKDPWTKQQLMEPSVLASILNNPKASKPLIFNIGVVENIRGARHMGGASEHENLERFKQAIAKLPANSQVVIYCGCCPFSRCPNIRPAFKAMQAAGLKNGRLLNLATNIKVDWINRGYPLQ